MDTCPAASMPRRVRGIGDSWTLSRLAKTIIANGRQSRKTLRQPTVLTRTPPTTGPSAVETPAVALHEPSARLRATGSWKVPVSKEIDAGVISEPPMPCSTRQAISSPKPDEKKHSSDAAPKSATPIRKIRRGP
ncbi:hypothetical protein L618_004000000050 [Rhodococcus rhodochrous J45]|uniref:Uncharacterized protein n=1 Tax=Rhodococcus rhodochrous J45 TaxID=935266 RepID=A0A562DL43_RHORH|nr:hypothetical protein L618_004000000050 [Rhodococcus rhodochrous J45]